MTSPEARLFAARTHSALLLLRIGPADVEQGSRVGGRAPAFFQASILRCPRCQGDVVYFCTLEPPELHAALGTGTSISVFYCRDFECLLKARKLQDDASLIVLAHPAAPRASTPTPFDSSLEGRVVLSEAIRDDINAYGEPSQGTKAGLSSLDHMPGELRIPSSGEVLARDVTPTQAFDRLMQWHGEQLAARNPPCS